MAARSCEIAEAARVALVAAWPNTDSPIPTFIVDDDWDVDTVDDLNEIEGRWVIVSDENYGQIAQATRCEDEEEYVIAVAFIERYTGALDSKGRVPKAWKEERKALLQNNIFRVLNNHRGTPIIDEVSVETCDVTIVMDRDFMRKNKVFCGVVEVAYRELREVT